MIAQQFIQFIFIGPSGVAYEIGSFHFVCLGIFLELYHNFFLNFGMGLETHMALCRTESDYLEKIPSTQIVKMDQKWVKNRVFWIYGTVWSLDFTEFVI